ncbi:methylated-DNA-[protein]-cysteine S-methyltransferase [Amphibacillus marinus]|uniref:methylated-DNA--[protein]-cysteine S-methyltransferase n=1 Tax=Amphibacillus marinus TaxID=872970 RepID=A0A1H8GQS3_9BACI|nr:methylated-DNA--[protein]-cysteine S-methyltransferase [Amphibacillus marinus]SEN46084.1 methylated-DNA-[protein]-cysteine S-methyltransferase [Amphibacillus marinus]
MDKQQQEIVYWSVYLYNETQFYLLATARGLCYMGSPNSSFEEARLWAEKKLHYHQLKQDDKQFAFYKAQLTDYFNGKSTQLRFPTELIGTTFQLQVWRALEQIPYGETRSYSDIAQIIKRPQAVRAVGRAIGANPLLVVVPCHRVMGKRGHLTGFRAGLPFKRYLLLHEQTEIETSF